MNSSGLQPPASSPEPLRTRHGRTEAEWETLRKQAIQLRRRGGSATEIAAELDVSRTSVIHWTWPKKKTQGRDRTKRVRKTCLKCDREFWSLGPWNRLCFECRVTNANALPIAEGVEG